MEENAITRMLEGMEELPTLRDRVAKVLSTLPQDVLIDLSEDSRFCISIDNYRPGKGSTVWMEAPSLDACSRSIVLKRRLAECSEEFAFYVIAHEFAHAYLRNGGWGEITDREDAADALADHWGHPRPNGPFPW